MPSTLAHDSFRECNQRVFFCTTGEDELVAHLPKEHSWFQIVFSSMRRMRQHIKMRHNIYNDWGNPWFFDDLCVVRIVRFPRDGRQKQ